MRAHALVIARRVPEVPAAVLVGRTAAQNAAQCLLGIDRHRRTHGELGRHDAIEDERAHTSGEAAQVLLRDAGAVGNTVEVDALVAESCAHALKIRHRKTRGVVGGARARTQQIEAALRGGEDLRVGSLVEALLVLGAVEGIGGAGAALIDEYNVALALDTPERSRDACVERTRRLSRPAGEDEERIGLLAAADRRHAGHVQSDPAAARVLRILGHLEDAAVGRRHGESQRMLDLAGCEG